MIDIHENKEFIKIVIKNGPKLMKVLRIYFH